MEFETLAAMPAPKLHSMIAKLEARSSELTTAMIDTGRGHERYSETARKTDSLSVECNTNSDELYRLRAELEYRRKMHGKDTPFRYANR